MTRITDERIEELRRRQLAYAKACRATGSPVAGQEADDIAAAMQELQEFRQIQRVLREVAGDADRT